MLLVLNAVRHCCTYRAYVLNRTFCNDEEVSVADRRNTLSQLNWCQFLCALGGSSRVFLFFVMLWCGVCVLVVYYIINSVIK